MYALTMVLTLLSFSTYKFMTWNGSGILPHWWWTIGIVIGVPLFIHDVWYAWKHGLKKLDRDMLHIGR